MPIDQSGLDQRRFDCNFEGFDESFADSRLKFVAFESLQVLIRFVNRLYFAKIKAGLFFDGVGHGDSLPWLVEIDDMPTNFELAFAESFVRHETEHLLDQRHV